MREYTLVRVSDGEQVTLELDEGWVLDNMDVLRQIKVKGVLYKRVVADEFNNTGMEGKVRTRARWPYQSTMSGVTANKANETRQMLKAKLGYTVDVSDDGEITYTGQKQRREVLRALGYYDRNAGYSDPTPNEGLREQLGLSPERHGFTG